MNPDYIFEVSWEVCNKVGGIHTVISTKAKTLVDDLCNNYILIGPDVWKETSENPEFEEDAFLYKNWKAYAEKQGIRLRIGRWKIVGQPIAILVDFTPCISEKNAILAKFWESYNLDSISGQWDYIEPALFGYAASKVIASFYDYYLYSHEKIIAHFHEWMTGTGLLYLKENNPQIATVFTTHATVLGRCIAGNGLPLYGDLEKYNPEVVANNFQVKAKYSLESLSAKQADCFTTVSDITNKECIRFLGKSVDVVTPNGFEDDFVPKDKTFTIKRNEAREKIFKVVDAILNHSVDRNAMLIINSGRYEFKNKGIDVFINAMGKLNVSDISKPIIAVIAVPAHHMGVSFELTQRLENNNFDNQLPNPYTTHTLYEYAKDPIIQCILENRLFNSENDKVKIIFVPSYLNGNDGVFNLSYFDFLIGFDSSIFPSYYEPWGYTPMESLAFHIPTITTTLSGFGQWIGKSVGGMKGSLAVIERNDANTEETINKIVQGILESVKMTKEQIESLRNESYNISRQTLWSNFIDYYRKSFDVALQKSDQRLPLYGFKTAVHQEEPTQTEWNQTPEWKKIFIKPSVPEALQDLVRLSQNLWWSWNPSALDLFRSISQNFSTTYGENPVELLASLSTGRMESLAADAKFITKMKKVAGEFDAYMADVKKQEQGKKVAYFSMEYGLHNSIKIFSGGLGMLAGDYLKEASDSNKDMVGIGLLYRYGYFSQKITKQGEQISDTVPQRFSFLPIRGVYDENGNWRKVNIALPGRVLSAKIWRCDVGRVPLYLLDTDIPENSELDRSVTYQLYGGDWENRLKQEMLLGIGGIRLLKALGIEADVFHNNEGHSAFNSLERMADFIQEKKIKFLQAREIVRASTLFTTHTPVPAGHDAFHEDLIRVYMSHFAELLEISWNEFMALGRFNPYDLQEKFSMSVLASNFSQEINGVSAIHGRVSREMFAPMYPGYFAEELHIGHVTNGVHFPTWVANSWRILYCDTFGNEFLNDQSNDLHWKKIYEVPDHIIWEHHEKQKRQLIDYIGDHLLKDLKNRAEDPKLWFQVMENLNKKALVIGFARRFATYKRAHLLFSNMERLKELVNHSNQPVRFVFAGKAHPHDKAGQDLIKRILEISKMPAFIGKIIFLENYDMKMAKHLVRGVDVWLNTPTRPLEASGTSGEKAAMNGVLNFSVLDGWWAEGYKEGAGWALSEEQMYENNNFQDELDAETIYQLLEDEIIPTYYKVNADGVPEEWVSYIKNDIAQIAPHFTMKRQIDDYYSKFYQKLFDRTNLLKEDNYQSLEELHRWKKHILNNWNGVELLELRYDDNTSKPLVLGAGYSAEVELFLNKINPEYIGVELVVTEKDQLGNRHLKRIHNLEQQKAANGRATYACSFKIQFAGVFDYAFRIYPKHPLLPHRQDFPLVKWI